MAFDGTEQLTPFKDLLNSVITQANARLQAGTGSRSITTAGVAATMTVTFPVAFATTPVVVVSATTGNPATRHATATAATTTGFTLNAINEDGTTAISFAWVAIGS
jgi:hypothetical protein